MMKKITYLTSVTLILLSLLLVPACGGNGLKNELESNQKLWASQKISHYGYQLRISCFCPPDNTQPVRIEVRDSSAVSRTYAETGETATAELIMQADTIEKIFAILNDAINGGADEITVEWDKTFGYPKRIYLDRIKNAIDDEIAYDVTQFSTPP